MIFVAAAPTLQELSLERCAGLTVAGAFALARAIGAHARLRALTVAGHWTIGKRESARFLFELLASLSLLSLSLPFETDEDAVMGFLAQNQKL